MYQSHQAAGYRTALRAWTIVNLAVILIAVAAFTISGVQAAHSHKIATAPLRPWSVASTTRAAQAPRTAADTH